MIFSSSRGILRHSQARRDMIFRWMCLENLQRKAVRRHPDQISLQLAPFDSKEQWLFSELLTRSLRVSAATLWRTIVIKELSRKTKLSIYHSIYVPDLPMVMSFKWPLGSDWNDGKVVQVAEIHISYWNNYTLLSIQLKNSMFGS